MQVGIDNELFKKIKNRVEEDLRNYPYFQISLEAAGEDNPVDEYRRILVRAIDLVYDKLDKDSKKIIDRCYFKDDNSVNDILNDLKVDKNKYYKLKNNAIRKFAVGLGYC